MKNTQIKLLFGILFSAVFFTQISCGDLKEQTKSDLKPNLPRQTKSDLETNRDLWRKSEIENYKMTIKIDKTGHAAPNGKFIITVRGGVAESIVNFDKPDVDLRDSILRFENYDTIEDIFSFIQSSETEQNWDRHEIEYDAKSGYPKKVDLDQSGVMDDELYFEVLEFEILESSGVKPAGKPSPPKVISVPATEITKAETSVRSRDSSSKAYKDFGGMSFSNDGTAFRSYPEINYEKDSNENSGWEKFEGTISPEQFQKLAQTLAENDFSNLKDITEQSSTDYILNVTYSGKTKSIKMSIVGKNTDEIKEILNAFETLKNQIDWKEIK
jgi:hypothetical protein